MMKGIHAFAFLIEDLAGAAITCSHCRDTWHLKESKVAIKQRLNLLGKVESEQLNYEETF